MEGITSLLFTGFRNAAQTEMHNLGLGAQGFSKCSPVICL
jgi:hypothetical protein